MRVFGIGLPRTGTNTLTHSLRYLGRSNVRHELPKHIGKDYLSCATDIVGGIPFSYKEIDERVPDAKFILTVRPISRWLPSIQWLYEFKNRAGNNLWFLEDLFGTEYFTDSIEFARIFQNHTRDVINYFMGRDDLLVLDIEKGSMEDLASFLDLADHPNAIGPLPRLGQRIE